MWRDFVALFVGINAVGGIVSYGIRALKRNQRNRAVIEHDIDHDAYQRRLKQQADEIDAERRRIEQGGN